MPKPHTVKKLVQGCHVLTLGSTKILPAQMLHVVSKIYYHTLMALACLASE
jgi:hypothetical protein